MSAQVKQDFSAASNVLRLAEPPPEKDLLTAFLSHTPANYLRLHHGYHGMTLAEAEQYIKDHHVP